MAKLKLGSKLLRGAQKVGRGTAKVGKIFGRAKSRVGGAVKSALPGGSAKGKASKVRGKMSLVPQALQPPEKMTPQARVRNIGRLVENKVQNLVPKLSKAVQRNVNAFDPQAFLGKIFDGGLNSLQNFASGLGGLQSSLQKSMGFINEAKGIIVDLIDKMAKAKPKRARGGIIKGLLKGAAVVGLAALAFKAAPAIMGTAAVGGKVALGGGLAAGGIALAKKVFGRKKKGEEELSKVKGEEINESFKKSLEKFDETLSTIDMQLRGKQYRKEKKEYEDEQKKKKGETEDDLGEDAKSDVDAEEAATESDVKPATDNSKAVLEQTGDSLIITPTPDTTNDDKTENEVKGDTQEDETVTESKVEPVSDVVNTDLGETKDEPIILKPQSLEFVKGQTGDTGSKGNRGALGSKGEPGKDGSSVEGTEGTGEPPKPEGFMRSMAGLGDFLSFGLTDFDKRGDLFKNKDNETKVGVGTTSSDVVPTDIKSDPTSLESRSQITEGISQPAMLAAIEAQQKGGGPAIAIPVGQKQSAPKPVMGVMQNEVPIMIPVDTKNIHITTSKSLFNIVDVL